MKERGRDRRPAALATAQGASYLALGLWPVVAWKSFERAYEPALGRELFATLGLGMSALGGALLASGVRGRGIQRTRDLGAASAATCVAVDLGLVVTGRISPAVLAEDALHLGFIGAWLGLTRARSSNAGRRSRATEESAEGERATRRGSSRRSRRRARGAAVTPGLEPTDPAGALGEAPDSEEAVFAREGSALGSPEVGVTRTGDEREIGRTGEGGLEGATGRDTTIGRTTAAPLTGGATPEEALRRGHELAGDVGPGDVARPGSDEERRAA